MKKKRLLCIILIVLFLWLAAAVTDGWRVCRQGEKPIFCLPVQTADDGGSGHYQGLGYSFDLAGNFLPEDANPGVQRYEYRIFGMPVCREG